MSYTEEYERPTIQKHSMLFTLSPAGCKLGHGLFPFQKRRKLDKPPINSRSKDAENFNYTLKKRGFYG